MVPLVGQGRRVLGLDRVMRVALGIALMTAGLAAILTPNTSAEAQPDIPPLPDACYDYDSGGAGMYRSIATSPTTFDLEVEGPVVQAVVEWAGIWSPDPANTHIGISIAGPGGTQSDPARVGIRSARDPSELPGQPSFAHGYFAVITDLFGDGDPGDYTVTLTAPDVGLAGENVWWGATVTVVYDTEPCADIVKVFWKTGADYYFGGGGAPNPTTATVVYDWGFPLPEDYTATFQLSHGGSQHNTTACRVSSLWVARGSGTAPTSADNLVSADGVPNPAWGAVEGIVRPFTPPMQTCPPPDITFPVTAVQGGHVGPQWALLHYDVQLPAGSTWAAFQLESPRDGGSGGTGIPESGTFSGGGLLVIPFPQVDPAIQLEKTVLAGDDPDACPGVEGTDELVVGEVGDPVTYCFRVINTGDTHLFPVTLDDPDLGITQDDMTLVFGDDTVPLPPNDPAPDGELVYAYVTTLTEDLLNTATVTGIPSDEDGDPLPDQDPVTDENDAEVRVVETPGPDIALEKTVLEGEVPDDCPGIEGTDELVVGEVGDTVTYCFRITNTGDTYLFPVTLEDPDLGIDQDDMVLVSGDPTVPLAPGGEIVYAYVTDLVDDLINTATTTGIPSDDGGDPLPDLDPVTDENDAEVQVVEEPETVDPGIALEKTVLAGDDPDACPGVEGTDELVTGEVGDPVTYCFRITNTGDTYLFPVTLEDPDLGIDQDDMVLVSGDPTVPLAPGGEIVYAYVTELVEDLINTATTTGIPSDEDGDPLPDQDPVEDDNDAEVRVLAIDATLEAFCDNDTPWLAYEITATGDVEGVTATITFSDEGESEVYTVDIGAGQLLWPGAEIDEDGNPIDWPGWDIDENGEWYLNPDNPYAWARGDVEVFIEVNPTFGPVTLEYPPAEPTCAAQPPPPPPVTTTTQPPLPRTGSDSADQTVFGIVLTLLGAAAVLSTRKRGKPDTDTPS